MNDSNPQIEGQLDKLATICCLMIGGDDSAPTIEDSTITALLKSLLMSGFARKDGANLQVEIDRRVKDQCRESAMHRGGELSSISGKLQTKFDEMTRSESRQPDEQNVPKAANISSATDA